MVDGCVNFNLVLLLGTANCNCRKDRVFAALFVPDYFMGSNVVVRSETRELAILDQASQMLAKASSLKAIKTVRDTAEAARAFAKAAQLGLELQNKATEIKLRAERKAGTVLSKLELRGGEKDDNPG